MLQSVLNLFRWTSHARRLLRRFDRNRTALEAAYFAAAAATGIPRGLRWLRCDWPDAAPILLTDRATGEHSLLVSVNVSFEAIEGGDMEDVAAVSTVRDATAVFVWKAGGWSPSGRTLFNMSPPDAAQRLESSHDIVPV